MCRVYSGSRSGPAPRLSGVKRPDSGRIRPRVCVDWKRSLDEEATAVASNIEGKTTWRYGRRVGLSRRPRGDGALLHGYYVVGDPNRTLQPARRYTCLRA